MTWIKSHLSALLLGVLLVLMVVLFATGKLQWKVGDKQRLAETNENNENDEKKVQNGNVVLDDDDFKANGIVLAPVQEGYVGETLEAPGEVQTAQNRLAQITPAIGGIIRSVHKLPGDGVAAGGALCSIESAELGTARAELQAALAERQVAQRNYERWKELYDRGLRSQTEVWTAEADYNKGRLRADAAMARLRALGISPSTATTSQPEDLSNRYELRSPISGTILQQQLTVGQNVEPKDVLFTIADLSQVWINASLHEGDVPKLLNGMAATIQIRAQDSFPVFINGEIAYIGQQGDQQTRTVPVRVVAVNRKEPGSNRGYLLRPGMFVTVRFSTAKKHGVTAVANEAIQQINGQNVVFVHVANDSNEKSGPETGDKGPSKNDDPNHTSYVFEPRAVTTGISDSNVTEITKGLKLGEKIVVRNSYLLKSEFEKQKIGDQH